MSSDTKALTQANAQATAMALAPVLDQPAADPVREPHFAVFNEWLVRFQQADDAGKASLESEGTALAQARLTAFADLVSANPRRALELAVPPAAREGLPESIRALLEKPINKTGDFAVLGTLPFGGAKDSVPALFRTATIEGEEYQAFTFGDGLRYVTKSDVPINGYAVARSMATLPPHNPLSRAQQLLVLDPRPARRLAHREVAAIKQTRSEDVLCSVSGQSWAANREETAAELGGSVFTFCGPAHLRLMEDQAIAASGWTTPGKPTSDISPGKSSYTEGRKRMLLMRPYWTNQPVAMTTNASITHFNNFSNYMWQMSYGKLTFAALGKGSDITPEMLIPGDVDSYVAGLGGSANDAWRAVRDVARTNHGYNLADYDFLYYVTTDQPSASYCGLGFVGGVGFHLANSCFDAAVSSHEFGHNLGLSHAHFWDTDLNSIIGPGQNVEYGDNNDPMGGGGNPNQFNSRYKNYLGWITNSDIATIPATGNNRYRLYAFDLDYGVGLRGLRFANTTPTSDYYWLNFRQRKTTSPALMNGAQLLWTDSGGGGSYLLDVRLRGSAGDNAIVIGRTFSDTNLNFHVTPIGKGNTYPESLDIVAVTGPQAGNLAPFAVLAASTLTPNVGQAVTFSASASDPNNDTLAYYWEFGDSANNYSSDNQPIQTHTFTSTGEFAVRCVVSDMRGGTAQHTLIVRVGNPNVFSISGHVVNERSQPMAGARVSAGSRSVFTDSDGSYIIPGLSAGSYTVSAIEPVRGVVEFIHPFWNNPVTVGPVARNIDFIVGTGAPPSTLVATGAVWKYFDKGTDLGTTWRTAAFSDAGWSNGPSQLGYGENDEATRIEDNATPGYNSADANRYITYYFRRSFNINDPTALTNVTLNVLRDDGVTVYLNGTEIFRNNLAAGATYLTTATNASDDGKTWLSASVPASLLVSGANLVAAEVHQDGPGSSDVTFDLSMTSESIVNTQRATIVYIESPADNAAFTSPTNITIDAIANGTPNAVTNVDIFAGASKLASFAAPPYTTALNDPTNGLHVLRAISMDSTGLRRTSAPVTITVSAPVPPPLALTFVAPSAVWKYFGTNVGAPANWADLAFNDSSWAAGPARLGFNSGAGGGTNIATVINGGPSNDRFRTVYFRHAFVPNDPAAVSNLTLTVARDDGIVVYLNGMELVRDNMPTEAVSYATLASGNANDNGQIYYTFDVPANALIPGTNVLAAEVHQAAANSSDLAFDAWLNGQASTNRGRGCWLVAPTNGSTVPPGGDATLTAEVVAGGALAVTLVEFYAGGVKIGEDATSPFSLAWNSPPVGPHTLVAIAHDSAGESITSAPVNITVSAPSIGDAFISFGDVWKYLDDGSDAGTAWRLSGFNDSQWMMGAAQLGYGDGDEVTTVSYGTNAAFKHITTYFRKKFVSSSPASFSGLLLRLLRDDGAVVYLNGTEVFRSNLQAGPVSYNSLAESTVANADETTPVEVRLSTAGLAAGTNTIAVEVHQDSIASSDLSFDLALSGLHNTNEVHGVYLTDPANNSHYNVPANVALAASAFSTNGPVTLVEYYAGTTEVGQATVSPYATTWSAASAGTHALTAVATFGAGERMTSAPVSIVVGAAPAPISPVFTQFINWGSGWRYWDSAGSVTNGWQALAFDDSSWPLGNARLGWGIDGEATLLTEGRVTHYFRRAFVVTNGGALDSLTFNVVRDDGIVVYVNGAEVFRTNMPAGALDSSTLASATVDTPDETIPVTHVVSTAGLGLRHGTNIVAVELHQASNNSSDGGFDLSLYGEGTSEERIYLGAPRNNSAHVTDTPILLEANAQAASGRTLTLVEFFADGARVGDASALPYRVNWSGASTGLHSIVARSLDNLGHSLTSAPVQISVGPQLISMVLIPSGSIWKYRDDGANLGTVWSQTNLNDAGWLSGPGELGYGDLTDERPEATVLCCSNAATKFITYYFRHKFVVPPNTILTNLTFRLLRDDGAVVYLNGREMYRSNMPLTAIDYQTRATTAVGNEDEATFFATSLAVTNVYPGTNLVAVEVHQQSSTSSDVSFDLQLAGDGYVLNSASPVLAASGANGQFQIAWPASATGYQLRWSPEIGPGADWQVVGGSPATTNGMNVLSIPPTNPTAFYRLQKP